MSYAETALLQVLSFSLQWKLNTREAPEKNPDRAAAFYTVAIDYLLKISHKTALIGKALA